MGPAIIYCTRRLYYDAIAIVAHIDFVHSYYDHIVAVSEHIVVPKTMGLVY